MIKGWSADGLIGGGNVGGGGDAMLESEGFGGYLVTVKAVL